MHCRPKRLIFIIINLFLQLTQCLLKSFLDLKMKLKMLALVLSLKDNTEYMFLKTTLNR